MRAKKILLKISGEYLKWKKEFWFDENSLLILANMIKEIHNLWIWIWIVTWWWNIYRWSGLIKYWVNPADSHNLSMLSTVFNGVLLKNFLEKLWLEVIVMDANNLHFLESYNKDRARHFISSWKIVIFVWWTSNPYFSTDTAWVLRALELSCDFMIKATKVDWVYDKDPLLYEDAIMFDYISYEDVILKSLKFMDLSAIDIAKNNSLIIKVLNLFKDWALLRAINWEKEGSIIS